MLKGVPRALCPLPMGMARVPNHDASSEVMRPCRMEVGVQVNHGACPLGFQQRGKKTLLSLTIGPDRCLRSRNCPAGQFTLSLGVMWLSYEGSFQTNTLTH